MSTSSSGPTDIQCIRNSQTVKAIINTKTRTSQAVASHVVKVTIVIMFVDINHLNVRFATQ